MDRFGAILIPCNRQQCTETGRVIVVMMSYKDSSDFSDVNPGFCKAPCDPIARIDYVMRPVDGQEIGGLRSMGSRWRAP
jgi:hypothetical protein